jgi:NAD-dependent deacetylase
MQLAEVEPNEAHVALARLERDWDVHIVTQNVDDLHERAGSGKVLHLHGELVKVRSTGQSSEIRDIGYTELSLGDTCSSGFQLRPHIVWFGEAVPLIDVAQEIVSEADHLLIVGTSLNVYPAAGLMHAAPLDCPITLVDPAPEMVHYQSERINVINEKATIGMSVVAEMLSNGIVD